MRGCRRLGINSPRFESHPQRRADMRHHDEASPGSIAMSRIPPVDRNTTDDGVRRNFEAIQKQLGLVPNMTRTMAQSPSVLEGYLSFAGALRHGLLSAALQEPLALVIAGANECDDS